MQNPSAGLESSGGSAVNSKPPARNTDECMKFNPPIRWGLKRHAAHKCESTLEDAEELISRRSDCSDFSREFTGLLVQESFFFLFFFLTPLPFSLLQSARLHLPHNPHLSCRGNQGNHLLTTPSTARLPYGGEHMRAHRHTPTHAVGGDRQSTG